MKLLLTAGYGRAESALMVADELTAAGHEIAGVVVVSALNLRRIRQLLRQRGISFLRAALGRLIGARATSGISNAQAQIIRERAGLKEPSKPSLRRWAAAHGSAFRRVSDINVDAAVDFVDELDVDAVIYSGGGILREPFIRAAKSRVLNAHAGPMPEIRGMNAIEWALLLDKPLRVTVHLIDIGIDTGPVLGMFDVNPCPGDDLSVLRYRAALAGIRGLCHCVASYQPVRKDPGPAGPLSRQCFVMAPAIREIAELKLTTLV